ncbi:hypothetical protein PCANC_28186 [Puccinia coronata f. sp. avenae]|uniref:Uncharacterized protein n=1 Tax=Puccinia coronata f. sp. avenae TaxID=200324 RepID=A0A2N5TI30_9BASI|nr:hypothetical protein PCANC_28186 [Puccinia coronata f. sp. avenae]
MGKLTVARPSSVKLTSIFPLARRFVICLYIQAKSGQTPGKLRANNRRLAVSHEGCRIILDTNDKIPPAQPRQQLSQEQAQLGNHHGDLDAFIQPPPPVNLPVPIRTLQSTTRGDTLLQSLLASARLSPTDLQLARQLFQAPPETQWRLQVVMWMLLQSASHAGSTALGTQTLVTQSTVSNHVYGTLIQSRVQHRIHNFLMVHTLESYSRPQSIDGQIFVDSPLPLIIRYIQDQSPAFKRDYLPPGFISGNHEAMASVVTFLRAMVKHDRTHLRNLLLTNDRQEHRPRELGPIPRLMDLLFLIDCAFKPRRALRTMAEIRADMTAGVQARIAMLCLLTMEHLVHRALADTHSQWDLIDDHLKALRVHAILVIRRNRELFTGNVMFANIPNKSIQMPGPIELDVEIRDVQA